MSTKLDTCPSCNAIVNVYEKVVGTKTIFEYIPIKEPPKSLSLFKVPFCCVTCGNLFFPLQAVRDIVFLYPKPKQEKIGSIIIPEAFRTEEEEAVVLSFGKGYYKKKTFIPIELELGDIVKYDKNIPWVHYVRASDGIKHRVKYCSYEDILSIVSLNV